MPFVTIPHSTSTELEKACSFNKRPKALENVQRIYEVSFPPSSNLQKVFGKSLKVFSHTVPHLDFILMRNSKGFGCFETFRSLVRIEKIEALIDISCSTGDRHTQQPQIITPRLPPLLKSFKGTSTSDVSKRCRPWSFVSFEPNIEFWRPRLS